MGNLKDWVNLLRVRQWYKNLVIFLAVFFSGNLFYSNDIYLTFLGFVSLCLISSSNYIINDFIDLRKDKFHPEKRSRPLVAKKIKLFSAIIMALMFIIISLILALYLSKVFFYLIMAIFILSQLYNIFLKNILFADILTIATLFVGRAISGAYLINVKISPWLILCPFFLSLFLSIGKRHADINLLKDKAQKTRKVLREYNHGLTTSLMTISTTLLTISYALYCFLSIHQNLLFTLPFALFVIFRYLYLINKGSIIARHPEKIVKDPEMLIGVFLWVIVTIVLLYV
jgi:4-hydroxybenzoate polyprenyltransferase